MRLIARVHRHDNGTNASDGIVSDHPFQKVGHPKADLVALGNSEFEHATCQLINLLIQPFVRQRNPARIQNDISLRKFLRRIAQYLGKRSHVSPHSMEFLNYQAAIRETQTGCDFPYIVQ